jgi:excisionase family DNA binding protein
MAFQNYQCMKSSSPEIKRLADSIAGLVTAITDMIKMQVQDATHAAVQAKPMAEPCSPAPATLYDPVMTKRQLAAHLHVSLRTIDNWQKKGYLPYYKIGKIVRFKLSDVQGALDGKLKMHPRLLRW